MKNRKSTLESRSIIIAEASENDYMISEEVIPEIMENLKARELPCSKQKILDTCMIYRKTKKALMGNKKEQEFLRNLNTNRHWIAVPWECFQKDGVNSWEEIEKMIPKEEVQNIPAAESIPEVLEEVATEKNDVVREVENMVLDFSEKLLDSITSSFAGYRDMKIELAECLDNLSASKTKDYAIKNLKAVVEKITVERDFFKVEAEELQEKFSLSQQRVRNLEKKIKKLSQDELTKRMLEALEKSQEPKAEERVIIAEMDVKAEKLNDKENSLNLPGVYSPSNLTVEYKKVFLDALKELCRHNKKLARKIIGVIEDICNDGTGSVTSRLKTMNQESSTKKTPPNSFQVTVKKYRFTMKLFNKRVIFYELFPRNKSPYAVNNS
ncbi:MAG: hypothetical protein PF549_05140 [Patescibacteria group bacterium]|nr:hypothetical protein [Patescibacteria group bacterium]